MIKHLTLTVDTTVSMFCVGEETWISWVSYPGSPGRLCDNPDATWNKFEYYVNPCMQIENIIQIYSKYTHIYSTFLSSNLIEIVYLEIKNDLAWSKSHCYQKD